MQLDRFDKAFASGQPATALRALVMDLAREGHTKTQIYELFDQFLLAARERPNCHEHDEDTLLGVMDALTGWRHPDAVLLPPQPGPDVK